MQATKQVKIGQTKPIVRINPKQSIAMFYLIGESKIITLITKTRESNLRKKDVATKTIPCPYNENDIWKFTEVNGMIGVNYESCVNLQLAREGKPSDFVAAEPVFGEKINNSKALELYVKANGELQQYVAFNPRNVLSRRFETNDGVSVSADLLKDFIYKSNKPTRQRTEKEVIWRKYKVESILGFRVNGIEYQIINGIADIADDELFADRITTRTGDEVVAAQ